MARSSDEIVAAPSEEDRVLIAQRIAEADRKLERLRRQDAAVVASLARSLTIPHGDDARRAVRQIEKFIKEIVKQELNNKQ
jgi:hypothetical protein